MSEDKKLILLPSYQEAMEYLDGFTNFERTQDFPAGTGAYGTARMEELLDILDCPQHDYPVLHISGTKGKGSTAYLTASLLEKMGMHTGLYVSPHVTDLMERIQIGGRNLNKSIFCKIFSKVRNAAEQMESKPSYFEMLTAIAYLAFSDQAIDIAVVEVGMGGRLDATNVSDMPVAVSAITPVSLEHTKILGKEVADIALEKAGIMRAGIPVVLGRQELMAHKVIERKAARLGCELIEVGRDLTITANEDIDPKENAGIMQLISIKTPYGDYPDIPLSLAGAHQRENALTALGLVENFIGAAIDPKLLSKAWKDTCPPGRFELVSSEPHVILDGAHNMASSWALAETLQNRYPMVRPKVMVFSACQDKDIRGMLKILLPLVDSVIFTTNNSPRHVPPYELAEIAMDLYPTVRQDVKDDPRAAVWLAYRVTGDDGLILVTGSLYLIGDVRQFCHNKF